MRLHRAYSLQWVKLTGQHPDKFDTFDEQNKFVVSNSTTSVGGTSPTFKEKTLLNHFLIGFRVDVKLNVRLFIVYKNERTALEDRKSCFFFTTL